MKKLCIQVHLRATGVQSGLSRLGRPQSGQQQMTGVNNLLLALFK